MKNLKKKYAKHIFNKILEESALWVEDKDDAIGLPNGEYLYNTFLDSMDKIVRVYKRLNDYIEEYDSLNPKHASEIAIKQCKKNIEETYHELRDELTQIVG